METKPVAKAHSVNTKLLTNQLKSENELTVNSALNTIRDTLSRHKSSRFLIDRDMFILIIGHIKEKNLKNVNLAVSISANICLNDGYRKLFAEVWGVEHLIALIKRQHYHFVKQIDDTKPVDDGISNKVVKINVDQELICRVWRLAGNLAMSLQVGKKLLERGFATLINEYMILSKYLSIDSYNMLCRSVRKCWAHHSLRDAVGSKDMYRALSTCLLSDKDLVLRTSMELISAMASHFGRHGSVANEVFKQLATLNSREDLNPLPLKTLSQLVRYCVGTSHIEGTGVAQIFVSHINDSNPPMKAVVEGLCALCREGAVRNLVKNDGTLKVLIRLCSNPAAVSPSIIISTFLLFQYDEPSLKTMAESAGVVEFLMKHTELTSCIQLLQVFARLPQPVPALVDPSHIDTMIKFNHCRPLLATIGRCSAFFETLVLSDRAWALCDAGCQLYEVGQSGLGEGVIAHHLGIIERRRVVALALPFLLITQSKRLMLKFFIQFDALSDILAALKETPTDQRVVAAVAQLASILPIEESLAGVLQVDRSLFSVFSCEELQRENLTEDEDVTFELDGGGRVVAPRALLCLHSPVIDAMLNGHFAEAGKRNVALPDCSQAALTALISLLSKRTTVHQLKNNIDTYLQLVSLTDRLLMPELGASLTRALLPLSPEVCAAVYLWALNAGHSANVSRLRASAYSTLLGSRSALTAAFSTQDSRGPLIEDVTNLFKTVFSSMM